MSGDCHAAIAQLFADGKPRGTAWVIAPGLVATAKHCLTDAREKAPGSEQKLTLQFAGNSKIWNATWDEGARPTDLVAFGRRLVKGIQRFPEIVLKARLRSVRCGTFGSPPSEPPCDYPPHSLRLLVSIVLQKPESFRFPVCLGR
jgi:hypothetical protein